MNNTYSIELTEQQVKILAELLNIAVKAGGLEVAKPAIDILEVIQSSINGTNRGATK